MCTVSMVGDAYRDRWFPAHQPPTIPVTTSSYTFVNGVSQEEFDALKREVEEMKRLLIDAKAQDIANGDPDCEMDEKVELLKRVADLVGVDLTEVFG